VGLLFVPTSLANCLHPSCPSISNPGLLSSASFFMSRSRPRVVALTRSPGCKLFLGCCLCCSWGACFHFGESPEGGGGRWGFPPVGGCRGCTDVSSTSRPPLQGVSREPHATHRPRPCSCHRPVRFRSVLFRLGEAEVQPGSSASPHSWRPSPRPRHLLLAAGRIGREPLGPDNRREEPGDLLPEPELALLRVVRAQLRQRRDDARQGQGHVRLAGRVESARGLLSHLPESVRRLVWR